MAKIWKHVFFVFTLLLLALVLGGLVTASAQGTTTYRVCTAGPPTCDFSSIQAAVDAAADGDTIQVAEGKYSAVQSRPAPAGYPGPATITQVLYISKSVTIRGGYTTGNWADSDPEAHPTILDAQDRGRVLFIAGDISPTIEGLILTNGNATGLGGSPWTDAGGGIYILTATATLQNCVVEANIGGTSSWGGTGGGLYLTSSQAVIRNNLFRHNAAAVAGTGYGGGLSLYNDRAAVSGNEVYSNTASLAGWGYGGGVSLYASNAVLTDNEIYSNTASSADLGYGGGIHAAKGHALLADNTIQENTASTASDGYGGGIALDQVLAVIVRTAITSNKATSDVGSYGYGGGLDLWKSDAVLVGDIIRDNAAGDSTWGYGGGFSVSNSTMQLINTAILGNRAEEEGSGLLLSGSTISLTHTTLAQNIGGDGSGLHLANNSSAVLTNTILVSHTVGITATVDSRATLDGVLWNGNVANSGGLGLVTVAHATTGSPAFAADGYHLTAASAALDAGIDAGVTQDIDNSLRPYQAPDLGADEYWPPGALHRLFLPLVMRQTP